MPTTPPKWDTQQLSAERSIAVGHFREERTTEPLDHYLEFYEAAHATFSDVMEESDDLRRARETAPQLLLDKERQHLCRYIASPPLSEDDLKTLANTSLAPSVLGQHPQSVTEVMEFILMGLDRERFPWVTEDREPSALERHAAILATSAMYATRKAETQRRSNGKTLEQELRDYLTNECGLIQVPATTITNASHGPQVGQFCGETPVVGGKADVVVRLYDGRLMPIECKVSNSETNSYKRLIHDCGEKAQAWVAALGTSNCVPTAVLSGCYSIGNLHKAQDMGLFLAWSHRLDDLGQFITSTR